MVRTGDRHRPGSGDRRVGETADVAVQGGRPGVGDPRPCEDHEAPSGTQRHHYRCRLSVSSGGQQTACGYCDRRRDRQHAQLPATSSRSVSGKRHHRFTLKSIDMPLDPAGRTGRRPDSLREGGSVATRTTSQGAEQGPATGHREAAIDRKSHSRRELMAFAPRSIGGSPWRPRYADHNSLLKFHVRSPSSPCQQLDGCRQQPVRMVA